MTWKPLQKVTLAVSVAPQPTWCFSILKMLQRTRLTLRGRRHRDSNFTKWVASRDVLLRTRLDFSGFPCGQKAGDGTVQTLETGSIQTRFEKRRKLLCVPPSSRGQRKITGCGVTDIDLAIFNLETATWEFHTQTCQHDHERLKCWTSSWPGSSFSDF